jgi:hypothetical protein
VSSRRIDVLALAAGSLTGFGCHPENTSYEAMNGSVELVSHDGRTAVHLVASPEKRSTDMHLLAIARGSNFTEGTIQVDVAGLPFPDVAGARGFIGVAFHAAPDGSRFECLYVRPTNGRADDQLRRNHSTQYVSYPDFPWQKLREANPGVYESYADMQPGVWTRLKIVVSGKTAKLYVNQADQPTLIVNDLKLGEIGGQVALWSYASTDAYFSQLEVNGR